MSTPSTARPSWWETTLSARSPQDRSFGRVQHPLRTSISPSTSDPQKIQHIPAPPPAWVETVSNPFGCSSGWLTRAAGDDAKQDSQLGTLNHLPSEIRAQIWLAIMEADTHYALVAEGDRLTWAGTEEGDAFALSTYSARNPCVAFLDEDWEHTPYALRQASLNLDYEYKAVFLRNHELIFTKAKTMKLFLSKLSTAEKTHVLRLNISLFQCQSEKAGRFHHNCVSHSCFDNSVWLPTIQISLPPNLRRLTFRISPGEDFHEQNLAFFDVLNLATMRNAPFARIRYLAADLQLDWGYEPPESVVQEERDSYTSRMEEFRAVGENVDKFSEHFAAFVPDFRIGELLGECTAVDQAADHEAKNEERQRERELGDDGDADWLFPPAIESNLLGSAESELVGQKVGRGLGRRRRISKD